MTHEEHKHKHTSGAKPAELFLLNLFYTQDPKDLSDSCKNTHKIIDYRILANFLDGANDTAAKLTAVRADANSSADDKKSALTDFVKQAKELDFILSDIKEDWGPRFSTFEDALKAHIVEAESVQLPNDFDVKHAAFKVKLEKADAEHDYLLDLKVVNKIEKAVGDADHSVDKVIAARALQGNEAPTQGQLGELYAKAKDDLTKVVTIATEMSTHLSEINTRIINFHESLKTAPAEVLVDIGLILANPNVQLNNFDNHLASLDTDLNTQHQRLDEVAHYSDFKGTVSECANEIIGALDY